MKRLTNVKKIIVCGVISCLTLSSVALAKEPVDNQISLDPLQNTQDEIIITPYSMYMRSSSVNFKRLSNQLNITVTTKAFAYIDHIYHDVTIYKNGYWHSSERYENWGELQLLTPIRVSAQSGDYFEIYVDHYTDHDGYLESMHSVENFIY